MRKLTLISNAVIFRYDEIPEEKFSNYVSMTTQKPNLEDFKPAGFPYKLQVEPTNKCNLSCPLCPVGNGTLGRKPRHMHLDEFKKLIDDMEKYLLILILWDWGEPFINPHLPEMIHYASDRGIKTITSTNAHFLQNDDYVGAILESGLSNLIVAIDSLNQSDYAVYRKKGDLNKALAGLRNLLKLKHAMNSSTLINLRMVVMKQNEQDVPRIRKLAREVGVDIFTLKTVNPSCGPTFMDADVVPSNPVYRRFQYRSPLERIRIDTHCRRVWHMSNIFSDGTVAPCCYDYSGELAVGNINDSRFTKIWTSPAYQALRKQVYYSMESIPKCNDCVINFKMSRKGEYPEVIYFNETLKNKVKNYAIDSIRQFYDQSITVRQLVTRAKRFMYYKQFPLERPE